MKLKFIKRFLCLALALLMVVAIVACGSSKSSTDDGGDDDSTANVTTTPTPTEPGTTTEPVNDVIDIPKQDFTDDDGNPYEFILYSRAQSANGGSYDAKYDGDVIHNAVYTRNKLIKEHLNCVITVYEEVGNTNDSTVETTLEALKETPTYHVVATNSFPMTRMATKGIFHDLNNSEWIDLEKDFYDDGYNAALNVGGRQYLATGKMTISWYRYQIVTIFNRNMFQAKGQDYLYDYVLDSEWTLAKMMEVAKPFYEDDGDAVYNDADTFGYYVFTGSGSSQTDGWMGAWNLRLIEKDDVGYFKKIDIDPTPWVDACNNYLDLLGSEGCFSGDEEDGLNNQVVEQKFLNAQAAMITYRMYIVESDEMVQLSRDREGYGIVPLAMASDEQDDYVSYVQDQVHLFGIPASWTGDDKIMTEIFLEVFAGYSYNETMPAYYEKALTKKYVYDEASKEMIKIIDSNVIVDPVNVYSGSGFINTTSLRPVYNSDKNVSDILGEKVLGDTSTFDTSVAEFNTKYMELDALLTSQGYENSGKIITEVDS